MLLHMLEVRLCLECWLCLELYLALVHFVLLDYGWCVSDVGGCFDFYVFFFFKKKTAYERRFRDWSSDVCSSDLERGDAVAQLAAVADLVDGAVVEQEFRTLEAFWQGLAHGLLDHARAGEADQGLRLGQVDVAEHRERGRHAAGGGMGHHRDDGQPSRAQARQRGRGLAIGRAH